MEIICTHEAAYEEVVAVLDESGLGYLVLGPDVYTGRYAVQPSHYLDEDTLRELEAIPGVSVTR